MAKQPPQSVDSTPDEYAQVTPRNLHPTSDIRFVITEIATLTAQVTRLIDDVRDLNAKVDPGQTTRLVDDVKSVKDKLDEVRHTVTFVRGAMYVIAGIMGVVVLIAGWIVVGRVNIRVERAPASATAATPATVETPPAPTTQTPKS